MPGPFKKFYKKKKSYYQYYQRRRLTAAQKASRKHKKTAAASKIISTRSKIVMRPKFNTWKNFKTNARRFGYVSKFGKPIRVPRYQKTKYTPVRKWRNPGGTFFIDSKYQPGNTVMAYGGKAKAQGGKFKIGQFRSGGIKTQNYRNVGRGHWDYFIGKRKDLPRM